jgi:hypothetical protein
MYNIFLKQAAPLFTTLMHRLQDRSYKKNKNEFACIEFFIYVSAFFNPFPLKSTDFHSPKSSFVALEYHAI